MTEFPIVSYWISNNQKQHEIIIMLMIFKKLFDSCSELFKDICRADPKSLTSLWPLLLPENDALQQRYTLPRVIGTRYFSCIPYDHGVILTITFVAYLLLQKISSYSDDMLDF